MPLPFNLEKLPPEMLDVLRFLGARAGSARAAEITDSLQMHERLVLRAIRRLVNYNLIGMDAAGAYVATSEGRRAYQALIEADGLPKPAPVEQPKLRVNRRLTAVVPGTVVTGQHGAIYIGVDPIEKGVLPLPGPVTVDLKLRALGAQISMTMASLVVPPEAAPAPLRVTFLPNVTDKPIRLIIDAYQAFQIAELAPAGNMYVDIPVSAPDVPERPKRAVAMTIALVED